jgi:RNA polymerase sigma factor (sigma-70 family)
MADASDTELMREYAERNSETAFAELVRRHVNLVYSVARRFTGNSNDAEEVTQAVFIIFARKAASLRERTALTGWLYETTGFTARQWLRTKTRQHAREQEAYVRSSLNDSQTDGVWKQLEPLLEEGMARLNEKERALLALRFFENKTGAETAALLGIQEWAAHKRVNRAVEKLRRFFTNRGIIFPAAVLATAISANSVQAAPVTLAKTVTAVATTKGAAASISTLTLIKGALKIMAWTKAKTVIVVGVVAIFATGSTIVIVKQIQNHVRNREIATALLEMHHQWATNDYQAKGMKVPKLLAKQGEVSGWSAGILGAYVEYDYQKAGAEWGRRFWIWRADTNTTSWILFEQAEPKDTNLLGMAWHHKLITVNGDP